jgi:uncharacterized protein (TIGR03085 family)
MSATEILLEERKALCETFEAVGPDAPTLCAGWTTTDLAAHLLVRETRPDAAIGIIVPGPFATHLQHTMDHVAQRGYDEMVRALRNGPPFLFRSGPMATPNVVENWVHHEDIRRARGDGPRNSTTEVDNVLWGSLGMTGRLAARRVHVGLELHTTDERSRVLRKGDRTVVVSGAPGELVLFMSGRKENAVIETEGDHEAVAEVLAARFGI